MSNTPLVLDADTQVTTIIHHDGTIELSIDVYDSHGIPLTIVLDEQMIYRMSSRFAAIKARMQEYIQFGSEDE